MRNFRDQFVSASLKPLGVVVVVKERINFRDQLVSASLKQHHCSFGRVIGETNFRDRLVSASLKRVDFEERALRFAPFPRPAGLSFVDAGQETHFLNLAKQDSAPSLRLASWQLNRLHTLRKSMHCGSAKSGPDNLSAMQFFHIRTACRDFRSVALGSAMAGGIRRLTRPKRNMPWLVQH